MANPNPTPKPPKVPPTADEIAAAKAELEQAAVDEANAKAAHTAIKAKENEHRIAHNLAITKSRRAKLKYESLIGG